MNRRGFLGAIGAALAAATLDPERALWIPGAKTFSLPPALTFAGIPIEELRALASTGFVFQFSIGDIITIGGLPHTFIVTRLGESDGITGAQLKMTEQSIARAVARRRHTRHMDRRRGA